LVACLVAEEEFPDRYTSNLKHCLVAKVGLAQNANAKMLIIRPGLGNKTTTCACTTFMAEAQHPSAPTMTPLEHFSA
jgi:hypothetical protein